MDTFKQEYRNKMKPLNKTEFRKVTFKIKTNLLVSLRAFFLTIKG